MAIHLFSTPVQCTRCGTVVEDPTVDKCPQCGELLKERRNPSRLAGVPRRYGQMRVLIGVLRFLGVIVFALGVMVFLFAGEEAEWTTRGTTVLAAVLTAVGLWVVSGLIDVALLHVVFAGGDDYRRPIGIPVDIQPEQGEAGLGRDRDLELLVELDAAYRIEDLLSQEYGG